METKVKWYNDLQILGTLLLLWPPIGIYGVYKSEVLALKWKVATCGTLLVVCILLAIT